MEEARLVTDAEAAIDAAFAAAFAAGRTMGCSLGRLRFAAGHRKALRRRIPDHLWRPGALSLSRFGFSGEVPEGHAIVSRPERIVRLLAAALSSATGMAGACSVSGPQFTRAALRPQAWTPEQAARVCYVTGSSFADVFAVEPESVVALADRSFRARSLVRRLVLARDGSLCRYCGGKASGVDHVMPLWRGGLDTPDNLVAACFPCNKRKGRKTPGEAGMVVSPAPLSAAE